MLISDLDDLENILDSVTFIEEPSIFTDEYVDIIMETSFQLIDEFIESEPNIILNVNFKEILLEEIIDIFNISIENLVHNELYSNFIEDDLEEILEDIIEIYLESFYPKFQPDYPMEKDLNNIENKINYLRKIPQPPQRTPEWYEFRWNLLTASNAWKAFETPATMNQLIYEKCLPIKMEKDDNENIENKLFNINSPMHWGQKYEPLSILIYENKFNTIVEDFGCIQHILYPFLGASPDGIIVNQESHRYGRMLEIKNVVSRIINGIPKKEYWTQMQLQMEVCDLDECDFLETKFIEYSSSEEFKIDSLDITNNFLSKDEKLKGEIIYFNTKEGKPFYIYKPLKLILSKEIDDWENEIIEKYENEPYNYLYIKTIYWKLEVFSCVLIQRNREWFQNNIDQLEKIWKIIEKERVSGYEHRAPIKRNNKNDYNKFHNKKESEGCFLTFDKIIKL